MAYKKGQKFYDPDEVMTIHAMVKYLLDDLDSLSDKDFTTLLQEMLEQSHLRRVFHVVEHFIEMNGNGDDIW